MKNFLLSMSAMVLAGSMMAQSSQLNLGVDLALPMGDFGKVYSLGVGPTVGVELPVGRNLGVTAQLAYDILMVKSDYSDMMKSASMIPIQLGAKYYFQDNQDGLYGHAHLGVHSMTSKTKDIDLGPLGKIEGSSNSSTNFSWGIGVGYQMESIDIGLRYNSITPDKDAKDAGAKASSYIGLRVAYLISFN